MSFSSLRRTTLFIWGVLLIKDVSDKSAFGVEAMLIEQGCEMNQ